MSEGYRWAMSPGEVLPLGCSLARKLAPGEKLTGTPTVTVSEETDEDEWTDRTQDFDVASEAVNTAVMEDILGNDIAIGEGASFVLTASLTLGVYDVLVACASTDGTNPAVRNTLVIAGPPVS